MVVTNNKRIADKVFLLRDHCRVGKYVYQIIGCYLRMDNLQAAILRVKLKYLRRWIKKSREIAKLYNKLLVDNRVFTPYGPNYAKSVYYVYIIRIKNRDRVQLEFKKC